MKVPSGFLRDQYIPDYDGSDDFNDFDDYELGDYYSFDECA